MNPLWSEKLVQNSKYLEGKKLLMEALADTQAHITCIFPQEKERTAHYQELLERFASCRGTPLFYPYIGSGIGNGPLVELVDGSIKYDLISGIGPHYFGHSFGPLVSSAIDGAMSDTVMQGNLQQNKDSLELCELLIAQSGMSHCFLTTSGAMSCENALKVAFQKKYPAFRILAFEHCFAGRTLALSQITDKPAFRQGLPPTLFVDYIPFYDANDHEGSIVRAKKELLHHLKRHPNEYAAMCLELIQGEGGFYVGNEQFFKEIITILKEHNIAIWVDEVQTFARTELLFTSHYFKLENLVDIITIGKASQVCATLFTKEFSPQPGLLSQTFTGSSSAIRAATFIISYSIENRFFGEEGKIAMLSKTFIEALEALHKKYPQHIHGPYGIGSMIAFTPLQGEKKEVESFAKRLFDNGVIGFTCGMSPTRIRFLLPVGSFSTSDIPPVIKVIEETLISSIHMSP